MAEHVQLGRIEEAPFLAVADEGVVLERVPEAGDHIHEFLGAGVAARMGEMAVAAEIVGLARVRRGDEVPARPATAEMVEGGELARHVERLVVGRGGGGHEADALCHRREMGEQGERLELSDVTDRRAAQGVDVVAADADPVCEKDQVELRRLGHLGEAAVMGGVDPRIRLRRGVPPRRDVVPARIEEGTEAHRVPAT